MRFWHSDSPQHIYHFGIRRGYEGLGALLLTLCFDRDSQVLLYGGSEDAKKVFLEAYRRLLSTFNNPAHPQWGYDTGELEFFRWLLYSAITSGNGIAWGPEIDE